MACRDIKRMRNNNKKKRAYHSHYRMPDFISMREMCVDQPRAIAGMNDNVRPIDR